MRLNSYLGILISEGRRREGDRRRVIATPNQGPTIASSRAAAGGRKGGCKRPVRASVRGRTGGSHSDVKAFQDFVGTRLRDENGRLRGARARRNRPVRAIAPGARCATASIRRVGPLPRPVGSRPTVGL